MKYEKFKRVVTKKILDFMPEEYQDCKVEIVKTHKDNVLLDGMVLTKPGRSESPVMYLNYVYADMMRSGEDVLDIIPDVISKMADAYAGAFEECSPKLPEMTWENVKDNIVFRFINTNKNPQLLADMPHREFLDLSIVYKIEVSLGNGQEGVTSVLNSMMDVLGVTEDELYEAAVRNTKSLYPPRVSTIANDLQRLYSSRGIPEEIFEGMLCELRENPSYVITNGSCYYGAINVLYAETLQSIAEKEDDDLYFVLTSCHEAIAASVDKNPLEDMAERVRIINDDNPVEEYLSKNVYFYEKSTGKISLAR